MISYAYLRVSTKDQNLERQEKAVKEFNRRKEEIASRLKKDEE